MLNQTAGEVPSQGTETNLQSFFTKLEEQHKESCNQTQGAVLPPETQKK